MSVHRDAALRELKSADEIARGVGGHSPEAKDRRGLHLDEAAVNALLYVGDELAAIRGLVAEVLEGRR